MNNSTTRDKILNIIALSKDRHGALTWAEQDILAILNEPAEPITQMEQTNTLLELVTYKKDQTMPKVEVGQKLKHVIDGTRNKRWESQAIVVKVTDECIVCDVQVDIIRTMTFDAKTWVNVNGREYGWLETGE